MLLAGKVIGFGLTGSFCTLDRGLMAMKTVVNEGAKVIPIVSRVIVTETTKFGTPEKWLGGIEQITGMRPWATLSEVEPIGPERLLDVLVIAPCTGATMSRLANGLSDTAVAMAAKSQLRNARPVVLAISTNDGLGLNARNLGTLLGLKHIYFVPFRQDNPQGKPNSLDARLDLLVPTVVKAIERVQIQPLLASQPAS